MLATNLNTGKPIYIRRRLNINEINVQRIIYAQLKWKVYPEEIKMLSCKVGCVMFPNGLIKTRVKTSTSNRVVEFCERE